MKGIVTTIVMMGGALAAGGAAAYFAKSYIARETNAERAQLQAQYQLVNVVVARSDLKPGEVLSNQTVALREVPRTFLHAEAVAADRWSDISGRVLARGVHGGETILTAHLAQGAGAGFSAQLPEGMRALTVPVDEQASISGMLSPGDQIDILFTTTAANESVTVPLLFSVPVIATGLRTQTNQNALPEKFQGSFRTITVSVTPADAAKITLAQEAGRITIALRQPNDQTPGNVTRISKNTLLSGDSPNITKRFKPRVQIILGGV